MRIVHQLAFRVHRGDPTCRCRGQPDDPSRFRAKLGALHACRATAPYQSRIELKTPLLVGFFLAGLVIHGGLQGWWIAPLLSRLPESPLFLGATALTAVNDNALITYLATLVPNLDDELKLAVVQGAVVGGGLTVIANAPNPAGQALLGRFFDGAILPIGLLAGALLATVIARNRVSFAVITMLCEVTSPRR